LRNLKVVHINTNLNGGAARAAYRIHDALLKNGIQSSFLNIATGDDNKSKNLFIENVRPVKEDKSFIDKQFKKVQFRFKKYLGIQLKSRREKESEKREYFYSELKRIKELLNCEIATLPFSCFNILENPLLQEADIIHLHWVAGMLDYPTFFKNNKKPIVWTLHDMNPFQGLFHYKEDEIRNNGIAKTLDNKILALKNKAIKNRRCKMTLVTPSKWLLAEAKNSKIFSDSKGVCINYPIDEILFSAQGKTGSRNENNIPEKNTVFLFVAEVVTFNRKGFDLLEEALNLIKDMPITLFVLGNMKDLKINDIDIRFLGSIKDDKLLSIYYSQVDAFIIPSREDNLPNVLLESLSCGTPVIGFPVGGIKEHVREFETGLLADDISSKALADTIVKFCSNKSKFDRNIIRDYSIKHFNERLIAEQYIYLYNEILEN
jgi:glycosyltransferase involved in cell wall biosynthesis